MARRERWVKEDPDGTLRFLTVDVTSQEWVAVSYQLLEELLVGAGMEKIETGKNDYGA